MRPSMTRLKFMVFALVVLGLWSYHLTVVSPAMLAHANESAVASLAGPPASVAQKLELSAPWPRRLRCV